MPLYEYRCPSCGRTFEELRRHTQADAPARCPDCGKEEARRLMSVPAAHQGGGREASAGSCSPRSGFT